MAILTHATWNTFYSAASWRSSPSRRRRQLPEPHHSRVGAGYIAVTRGRLGYRAQASPPPKGLPGSSFLLGLLIHIPSLTVRGRTSPGSHLRGEEAHTLERLQHPNARLGGCGATLPSDRRSDAFSLGSSFFGGVRRPPWLSSSSSARGRAPCGGPSCHWPPLWPILTRQIDSGGDLGLVFKLIANYIRKTTARTRTRLCDAPYFSW